MPWYEMYNGPKIEDFICVQLRICEAGANYSCSKVQFVYPVRTEEYPISQVTLQGENACAFYVKALEPAGWHKPLHKAN